MGKNKEKIRKKIINFADTEYRRAGIVPSARAIDKKFNTSFWSYFPKGMNTLYKLCGFKFSPEENKQKSRKEFYSKRRTRTKKEIVKYFIQQIKKGVNPTATNIGKRFSISLLTYFPGGIRELYKMTKTDPPASLKDRGKLRKEIIGYIQSEVRKGHYPTRLEINEKFHTNIQCSIRKLYELAGVEYKRDPNPFLRYRKEKKLTEIAQKLFTKLRYKIKNISIGPSNPSGADIVAENKEKQFIPIEIKAFQKFGKIGQADNSPYIRNEFLQLKRYIKNLHAPYGYLVTSTDRKTFNRLPSNIKVFFGEI
ncbi:MAG: hypothetical protein QME61_03575 [Patescibacteria group bacterium]|nr:hypothetical protein [Patescibacteria group bacterium]